MELQQLCRTVLNAHTGTFGYADIQENHINLGDYTLTVGSYVSKCIDYVIITKLTPEPKILPFDQSRTESWHQEV